MCAQHETVNRPLWLQTNFFMAMAVICGILIGLIQPSWAISAANAVSQLFMNLLRLVSLPIIFLSIVATASGMESAVEVRFLGSKTVKYTLITTLLSASIALFFFILVDPVSHFTLSPDELVADQIPDGKGYWNYLMQIVPPNFLKPFIENNVMGVLFLAMLLSSATLALPQENRKVLHSFFHSLFLAIMRLTSWIILLMPLAVTAFIILFINDVKNGLEVKSLALYLFCVVAANLVQASVTLPILLKTKGIAPWSLFKAMFPALSVAFFSKSSGAALPMAMRCAIDRAAISRKVANFSLPLCTTINMNGCAAFILITVLFVSMTHGFTYTPIEMFLWVFIATIAAIGNASVPMGCYFLSSAFLAAMGVPLNILGVILPFYTFIDMLETAINVWSDSCVAALVDREVAGEQAAVTPVEGCPQPVR